MDKRIKYIRDWIRTNGEMSEDGKSVTYDCNDIEKVIEQALNLPVVSHRRELLTDFLYKLYNHHKDKQYKDYSINVLDKYEKGSL